MKATIWLTAAAFGLAGAAAAAAQSLDPAKVTQPAGVDLYQGEHAALAKQGERLFNDPSIGESGLACANCHENYGQYKETFKKPYPHFVNMAKAKAGLEEVNAAEMVQLCMVVPMQTDPLAWDSEQLAALAAYVKDEREAFAER